MHTIENRELSKISLLLISTILTLFFIVLNPLGTAHSVEVPVNTIHSLSSIVDGDLIKTENNPDIYIVKLYLNFRYKRLILNPDIFESYGHLEWSNVKIVSQTTLNSFVLSNLVREVNADGSMVDGRIFLLLPNGDTGIKRHIQLDKVEFITGGGNERSIYNINHTEASETFYSTGSSITTSQEIRRLLDDSIGEANRIDREEGNIFHTLPLPDSPSSSVGDLNSSTPSNSPNSSTPSNPSNSPNSSNPFTPSNPSNSPNSSTPSNSPQQAITSFTKSTLQPVIVLPNSTEEVLSLNALSSNRGITIRRLNILLSPLMGQDTVLENTFNQVQLVSGGNVIATKNISSSDDYQEVLNYSIVSFGNLAIDVEEDSQKSIEIHISTNETLTESLLKDWNIVIGQDDIYSLDDSNNSYYNTNPITSSFSVRRTLSGPTPPPTVRNFRATQALINSLTLEWNEFKDAVSYELDYCMGSSCTNYTNLSTVTTETKTLSSLQVGTIYRFRIRAKKANNIYSGYKVLTQATLLSTPSLTLGTETKTSIQLSWNAIANADGYMIEHCIHTLKDTECTDFSNPKTIDNGSETSTTITGLVASSIYQLRIKATGRYPKLSSAYSYSIEGITDFLPPTNLRVVSTTDTTIDLAWDAVPMGFGYAIKYCDGDNCIPDETSTVTSPDTTTKQITLLIQNTEYILNISTLHNRKGNSDASDTISGRTTLSSPSNLRLTATSLTSITLGWDAVVGASGYILQSCEGSSCTNYSDIYTGTLLTYQHTGLQVGVVYKFRVKTTGQSPKLSSGWSDEFATTGVLQPPTNFRSTAQTDTTAALSWNLMTGAEGYTIQYCDGISCTPDTTSTVSSGSTTTKTITGLTSNTTYVFQIKSTHTTSSLNSEYSSTISTSTKLSTPSNFRTTAQTSTRITVGWDAVTGASGYTLERCDGTSCIPSTISNRLTTSFRTGGLTPNTIYRFQIRATHTNPVLNSSYSSIVSISTKLSTPSNFRIAALQSSRISLAWDASVGANGYTIKYCDGVSCSPTSGSRTVTVSGLATAITGLTANTIYRFQIIANHTSSSLSSEYSSILSQSTALATPGNVITLSQSSSSVTLDWSTVSGANGYKIQYCDGASCTPDEVETVLGGFINQKQVIGLTSNTEYRFQIQATHSNSSLNSTYSSIVSTRTVLAAPTNLRATAQTSTSIFLAWDAVNGADGYTIQYCDGLSCTPDETSTIASGSTTAKTITGLTSNTIYRFQIKSTGTAPEIDSAYSSTISQSTSLDTPTNLRTTAQTGTTVSLEWDAITGANGYTIDYCDGDNCTFDETSTITGASITQEQVTGLTPNTIYRFQIKATHTNSSLDSASSSIVSTRTALAIPTNLRKTAQTSTSISLAWDAVVNANGYTIEYCDGLSCTPDETSTIANGSTTAKTITGLTANTTYRFQIKSTGTAPEIDSAYSSTISQSTSLDTPTNLRTTAQTGTTVSLEWDLVTNANGYEIEYCDGTSCTPDQTETMASGSTTKTISSLTANTTYVFQIRATHTTSSLNSSYSSTVSTNTTLSAPSNLRATAQTSTSISLAWDAVVNANGYTIEYCDGVSCTPNTSFIISDGSTTSITTGLTSNTIYRFRVRATHSNLSLNSPYSNLIPINTILNTPTNLRTTGQAATSISLAWDAVVGAGGYTIRHCRGSGCAPSTTETIASGSTTTSTVTGLHHNSIYRFRVRATHSNSSFNGGYSSTISTNTILFDPANLRLSSRTDVAITLTWNYVNGSNGYEIRYCDGSGCTPNETQIVSGIGSTTTTIAGLTPNSVYRFQVRATHSNSSLSSVYSNIISINTILAKPTNLRLVNQADTSLTLEWDVVAGANGYTIQYCDGTGCTLSSSQTNTVSGGSINQKQITGLTANTVYRFQTRATHSNSSLNSEYSDIISGKTTLDIPANLRINSQTSTTISLAWDAVVNANGYTIEYCDGAGCTLDQTEIISSGSTTSSTITNLTQGTVYVFQIRATHTTTLSNSPYSSPISTSTKLSTPSNFRTTAQTSTSIALAWDVVVGAGSYTIEYCDFDGVDCDPNVTIQILDGLTTDHTITPLLSNTIYRIHIRAIHTTASLSSPYSSLISPRTKLSTPSNFRTTAQTSTTIALAWSVT